MSKPAAMPEDYASTVRAHYEELPYPFRDPNEEGKHFHGSDGFSIDAFSHMGWAGKRDLRDGGRFLVAGCGTGDTLVALAEQLLGSTAQLVAVDLSLASIAIAKARLAKRGLSDRVVFHHRSILDITSLELGLFDVIESSGVLHHLPDPNAGLAALANLLAQDGLMAIMVYAQYGRQSIYLVQALMKQLMDDTTPRAQKIEIAREFLNNIPHGHWLTVNNDNFLEDIRWPDGSGIYDLFLHSVDRAYTVPQLYEWLAGSSLQLTQFFSSFTDDCLYKPECYSASPLLNSISAPKTEPQRHAIAELMNGNMCKHSFYAAKQPKQAAQLADDMVISYGPMQWLFIHYLDTLLPLLAKAAVGERIEVSPRPFATAPSLQITKAVHTEMLLRLINGEYSVGQIIHTVTQQTGASVGQVGEQLAMLYSQLRARQMVFLRHASIPPYINASQIIQRFNALAK